jgi:hypothetical protein
MLGRSLLSSNVVGRPRTRDSERHGSRQQPAEPGTRTPKETASNSQAAQNQSNLPAYW